MNCASRWSFTKNLKLGVVVDFVFVKNYLDILPMLMISKHTYLLSYNSIVFHHTVEASTWSLRNISLNQNPQETEMQCKICTIHRRSAQTETTTGTNHKQNCHNYSMLRKHLQL